MMTSPALMSKSNFFTSLSPDSMMLSNHINVNTLPFTFLGDESCSEVSSSSPITCGGQSPPPLVNMGPHFNNTEMTEIHQVPDHNEVTAMQEAIGETPETNIDLNFWELAINASSPSQMFGGGVPVSSTTAGMNARSFSFFTDEGTSPIGRDDLSPASSINSTSLISESGDKKKKGSGGARQTEELCLVCGDRASGYHYNALTCEGCKGFFRRSITKKAVYSCKYGQHCEMDMYMRRKCQECRFKKCISVGMRPECVVPEHTCQVKRQQKKEREKDKVIKVEYNAIPEIPPPQQFVPGLPPGLNNLPSSLKSGCRIELTKEHQELINRLINNQDEYETPPEESITSVPNGSDDEARFQQITEMTKLTVELIVKFALSLPGFMTIPVEDQVTLLKACTSELITLRASRRYHADSDSIVFANNSPCTRDFYKSAGMDPAITDSLFAFCKRMAIMKVDNAEYALLAGIALFSERPSLIDPERVEKIQFLYVETLYAYVTNKWAPKSGTMIAKLLDVLTQLRSLGIMNNEQCETFVSKDKQLPDLLIELWDVNRR